MTPMKEHCVWSIQGNNGKITQTKVYVVLKVDTTNIILGRSVALHSITNVT